MAEFGLNVNDANGLRVADNRMRSWEAVSWGTISAVAYSPFKIDIPASVDFPMVFTKYLGGEGFLVRGRRAQAEGAQWFLSTTTRDIPYVVAGFRNNGDGGGGWGIAKFDGSGRCTFSTSRAFLRPNFPTLMYTAYNWSNDVQSTWSLQQPTAFSMDSYLYWQVPWAWDRDGSNKWIMGLAYGLFLGMEVIALQRISVPNEWNGAPWYLGSNSAGALGPGVTNQMPKQILITEFFPPA